MPVAEPEVEPREVPGSPDPLRPHKNPDRLEPDRFPSPWKPSRLPKTPPGSPADPTRNSRPLGRAQHRP